MKNIIYGAGVVTVLTTLVFMLLGKVDVSTGVMIDTAVLGLLYGIVQKMENKSTQEDFALLSLELDYEKKEKKAILTEARYLQSITIELHDRNIELESKLKASTAILPELKKVVEDVVEKPVKKSRTRKPKVDKK